jgi:hypothetical protein
MFVEILSAKVEPGKLHEAVAVFNGSLKPVIQGLRGLRWADLIVDGEAESLKVIHYWESREDAEAASADPAHELIAQRFFSLLKGRRRTEMMAVAGRVKGKNTAKKVAKWERKAARLERKAAKKKAKGSKRSKGAKKRK